jgi:hypothetical protein
MDSTRQSRLENVAFWAACVYIAAILLGFAIWAPIKTAMNHQEMPKCGELIGKGQTPPIPRIPTN